MAEDILHDCGGYARTDAREEAAGGRDKMGYYGDAIREIRWRGDLGFWIAENGEYATVIDFCPWCGKPLRTADDA